MKRGVLCACIFAITTFCFPSTALAGGPSPTPGSSATLPSIGNTGGNNEICHAGTGGKTIKEAHRLSDSPNGAEVASTPELTHLSGDMYLQPDGADGQLAYLCYKPDSDWVTMRPAVIGFGAGLIVAFGIVFMLRRSKDRAKPIES